MLWSNVVLAVLRVVLLILSVEYIAVSRKLCRYYCSNYRVKWTGPLALLLYNLFTGCINTAK